MKVISWNGVGGRVKRVVVKSSIKKLKADPVLLQETKIDSMEDRIVRDL